MLNLDEDCFHIVNEFDNFFDYVCPLCGGSSNYACDELSKIRKKIEGIFNKHKKKIKTIQ